MQVLVVMCNNIIRMIHRIYIEGGIKQGFLYLKFLRSNNVCPCDIYNICFSQAAIIPPVALPLEIHIPQRRQNKKKTRQEEARKKEITDRILLRL